MLALSIRLTDWVVQLVPIHVLEPACNTAATHRAAGLRHGPRYCVTPLAVMDFDPETLRMRLKSVHEGVSVDQVIANTGFELLHSDTVAITEPPDAEDLRLLREVVDPKGLLRV